MSAPQDRLLTVVEVAQRLSVRPRTVYDMCHADVLTFVRVGATGRGLRIPESAVEDFIEWRRREANRRKPKARTAS